MIHFDVYRITTDRWHRTWQCEWEGAPCARAVRAWTRRGVERKAWRAFEAYV